MPDLHLHTYYSDGDYSPADIVAVAAQKNLSLIAITDHDTMAGVAEAIGAGKAHGVKVITGVEFSVDEGKHLLGYDFDPENALMAEKAQWCREQREMRNQKMIDRLRDHGMSVSFDELLQYARKDLIGRPHFAQLMVAKGYVQNDKEAFDKYIDNGRPCYVGRKRLSAQEAIGAIKAAGGYAVWADPMHKKPDPAKVAAQVAELKSLGLAGLEVYYPEHDPEQTAFLLELCRKHQLFATAGSDYHGQREKNGLKIEIGRGWNGEPLPNHLDLPFA